MPKRGHNEGSITYDKSKQAYLARISVGGKRIGKRFKDEQSAKDWLIDQKYALNRNMLAMPNQITVGQWMAEYLETYSKPAIRTRSYERNVSVSKHLTPIDNIPIQQLNSRAVQKVINNMAPKYAVETRRKVLVLLKQALKCARINNIMNHDPAEGVVMPPAEHKEIEIYTIEEVEKVLAKCTTLRWKLLFQLMFDSGVRLSEALGLRWQDVDTDNGIIHIRQILQLTQKGFKLEPPKTKKSRRSIDIPESTTTLLREFKKTDKLVFTTRTDTPLQANNVERYWNTAQVAAGVPKHGTHSLRHTHASLLLAAGVSIVEVSARLGHSKVSTTLDIYAHCLPGEKLNTVAKWVELKKCTNREPKQV